MSHREGRAVLPHPRRSEVDVSPTRSPATHVRVAIGDRQDIYRHGVRTALARERDLHLVAEAGSLDGLVHAVRREQPDILLIEPSLLDVSASEGVERLRGASPRLRVLVLADSEVGDDVIVHLKAGAFGYLMKSLSADELIRAIRRAHRGHAAVATPLVGRLFEEIHRLAVRQRTDLEEQGPGLTRREAEVLHLIGLGKSNHQIGRELSLSEHTVKNHVRSLFKKLGVRSRTAAAMVALRQGLV